MALEQKNGNTREMSHDATSALDCSWCVIPSNFGSVHVVVPWYTWWMGCALPARTCIIPIIPAMSSDDCEALRTSRSYCAPCITLFLFFARRPIGSCNLVLFVHHRLMRGEKSVHDSRIGAEPFVHCET